MLRRFVNSLPKPLRRQKLLRALCASRLTSPIQLLEFNTSARAYVDLRDAESRATYLSQSFWPEFPPMVAAFLRNGGEMFDVGANFGLVTFGVAPLVAGQGAGFHLFEANPRIIPTLKRSASLYPNERFTINHCCVTDQPGISRHSLIDDQWGHGRISETGIDVPNLVLDDYVEASDIKHIAFMKMDIEGWEPLALKGMVRSLSSGIVKAAFVEAAPTLSRTNYTSEKLLTLLSGFGFDLYFCGMWDSDDPYGLKWIRVDVNGTSLRFAKATPLPSTFIQGDVMAIHQTAELSQVLRSSFEQ